MNISQLHAGNITTSHSARPWAQYTLFALAAILLVRLVSLYFNTTELFFDEAQYWLWGKEPAFGYFSKPPVLGWTIAVFTAACGSDSEFCIRLPSPIIHTGTALLIFLGAARLFDQRTGFWSAITFVTLPGITLSSTLISTDVPLLFFWAGALWAFLRLSDKACWQNVLLLGFFLGAGLMSKYAMAYFFLCTVLFALFEKSARQTVFSRHFLAATLLALLVLTPNLLWNFQNSFITAAHTGDNIGWSNGLRFPGNGAEFLGSQFGVFGPILFAFYLIALVRFWREGWDSSQKFLVLFSLPVFLLIAFQGFINKAYANWAAVTYIAASILIADILVNRVPAIWNKISLTIHLFLFAGLSVAVAFSTPGLLTLPNGAEPFTRLQGARAMARATGKQLDSGSYVAVVGPYRNITAQLVYYLRERPQKVFAFSQNGRPNDHYELTRPYRGTPNGPLLLVSASEDVSQYLPYFSEITPVTKVEISSGNVRRLWFFKLQNYNPNGRLKK
ncbi:MAG: glycosyltransferase family 39 protein [Rhizobiaceae bacterium]|nr:glycosyltransferase family 39 protein [Rhizobiaceae bacterium]